MAAHLGLPHITPGVTRELTAPAWYYFSYSNAQTVHRIHTLQKSVAVDYLYRLSILYAIRRLILNTWYQVYIIRRRDKNIALLARFLSKEAAGGHDNVRASRRLGSVSVKVRAGV